MNKRYYVHLIVVNPYTDMDTKGVYASELLEAEREFSNAVEAARELSGGSEAYPDGMDIVVRLIASESEDKPRVLKARFISEAEGIEVEMDGKEG